MQHTNIMGESKTVLRILYAFLNVRTIQADAHIGSIFCLYLLYE